MAEEGPNNISNILVIATDEDEALFEQQQQQQQHSLQDAQNETSSVAPCDICHVTGAQLSNGTLVDTIPPPWTLAMTRPAPGFINIMAGDDATDGHQTLTCRDWTAIAIQNFTAKSSSCLDLRDYLAEVCCRSSNIIVPLYQCRTAAKQKVHLDSYDKTISPVARGTELLTVGFQIEMYNAEVLDHGVNGGSIQATGEVRLDWVDERLSFVDDVADEMGCYSYTVNRHEIWTPGLTSASSTTTDVEDEAAMQAEGDQLANLPDSTLATVLADGRVQTRFGGRRPCNAQLSDQQPPRFVL